MKKLNTRLQVLKEIVLHAMPYDHIWDICCDHGYLGMALLNDLQFKNEHATVHFVDNVPHIIQTLRRKLTQYRLMPPKILPLWQTHCIDANRLFLPKDNKPKHLIIIAGVGGDLTAAMVTHILQNNTNIKENIDFLLCPVQRNYALRQVLIQQQLNVKTEQLIKENKRFYEASLLTLDTNFTAVNSVGAQLWEYQSTQEYQNAKDYLQQVLTHYQKVRTGFATKQKPDFVKQTQVIINEYKTINLPVSTQRN